MPIRTRGLLTHRAPGTTQRLPRSIEKRIVTYPEIIMIHERRLRRVEVAAFSSAAIGVLVLLVVLFVR